MSKFKTEVSTDDTGKWYGNAMVYYTFEEGKTATVDLAMRWFSVKKARVVEYNPETDEVLNTTEVF